MISGIDGRFIGIYSISGSAILSCLLELAAAHSDTGA